MVAASIASGRTFGLFRRSWSLLTVEDDCGPDQPCRRTVCLIVGVRSLRFCWRGVLKRPARRSFLHYWRHLLR
ncbi:hypothetical protein KCP76_05610 [Salmonella enterica subsp. enterica serovar Weltevreden]|nr:hypothetical protein KCP76_05610 [Salmonella enterica subsp. enterica serovar Weltevreden]